MKKAKKVIIVIISIIAILLVAAAGWLHFSTYHPSSAAKKVAQTASQTNKATVFKARHNKMTVIFYTGALVEPDSYSIWAKQVANAGYTVKIVHFPLNLAFFNVNAADKLAGKIKIMLLVVTLSVEQWLVVMAMVVIINICVVFSYLVLTQMKKDV